MSQQSLTTNRNKIWVGYALSKDKTYLYKWHKDGSVTRRSIPNPDFPIGLGDEESVTPPPKHNNTEFTPFIPIK